MEVTAAKTNLTSRQAGRIKLQVFVFAGFWLLLLILHILLATQLQYDDIWFGNLWNQEGFNLFSWLGNRYQNWSSRILIEFLLVILCRLPLAVFWIIDSLVMTAAAFLLYRLFAPSQHKVMVSIIVCLLFLCLPFHIYTSVGWIAGTLNYLWPMAALLAAGYGLKKLSLGSLFAWYEWVICIVGAIFATQSEQTAVVFLAVSAGFFLWSLSQKKVSWLSIAYLGIAVLGLLFILTCPGNGVRITQETVTWFPDYAGFSLLQKADLSFSVIAWNFYANLPIFSLLLSSLMIYLTILKHRSWQYRVLAALPFAFTVFLQVLFRHYDFMSVIAGNRYGIYSPGHLTISRFLFYGILLFSFCLLLVNVYLIFGHNIQAILGAGVLLLGFATQAMLGFSPTVWDSGSRTGTLMFFSVIALFVYLLQEWDFRSKTANQMLLLPLAAIAGYTILDEIATFSPYFFNS